MTDPQRPVDALERARSSVDALPPSWESTERRRRVLASLSSLDAGARIATQPSDPRPWILSR